MKRLLVLSFFFAFSTLSLVGLTGCSDSGSSSVVAPPSDEAARAAQKAAEEAYDKELAEGNS